MNDNMDLIDLEAECLPMPDATILSPQSADSETRRSILRMLSSINEQLGVIKNLNANLIEVRRDLSDHVSTIRSHLISRERDITKYLDDIYAKEIDKLFANIKEYSELTNTAHIQLSADTQHDSKVENPQHWTFKPLYSVDIGMVMRSDSLDYDFTSFGECNGEDSKEKNGHLQFDTLEDDIHSIIGRKIPELAKNEAQRLSAFKAYENLSYPPEQGFGLLRCIPKSQELQINQDNQALGCAKNDCQDKPYLEPELAKQQAEGVSKPQRNECDPVNKDFELPRLISINQDNRNLGSAKDDCQGKCDTKPELAKKKTENAAKSKENVCKLVKKNVGLTHCILGPQENLIKQKNSDPQITEKDDFTKKSSALTDQGAEASSQYATNVYSKIQDGKAAQPQISEVSRAPPLPAKSAKLVFNHTAKRRRKSLTTKGLGYLSIHRTKTEAVSTEPVLDLTKISTSSVPVRKPELSNESNIPKEAATPPKQPEVKTYQSKIVVLSKDKLKRKTPAPEPTQEDPSKEPKQTANGNVGDVGNIASSKMVVQPQQGVMADGASGSSSGQTVQDNIQEKEKDVWFVQMSEANLYSKCAGREEHLKKLKKKREEKEQADVKVNYQEINFVRPPLPERPKFDIKVTVKGNAKITVDEKLSGIQEKKVGATVNLVNSGLDGKEEKEKDDGPPLPPRMYAMDEVEIPKSSGSNTTASGSKASVKSNQTVDPNKPRFEMVMDKTLEKTLDKNLDKNLEKNLDKNAGKEKRMPPANVQEGATDRDVSQDNASGLTTNPDADAPGRDKRLSVTVPPLNPEPKNFTELKAMCSILTPEVLIAMQREGYVQMRLAESPPATPTPPKRSDSIKRSSRPATPTLTPRIPKNMAGAAATAVTAGTAATAASAATSGGDPLDEYENVEISSYAPSLWEKTIFTELTSVAFLSDTRIVLLDGSCLKFVNSRTGNVGRICALKQFADVRPLRLSCSPNDQVIISSPQSMKIMVIPTSGTNVKGTFYAVPDVSPDFSAKIESGYIIGGSLWSKEIWKPGVAVFDNKFDLKYRWKVKGKISEMAVTSNRFYMCLPDLPAVQVHNLQGALLYSFGDKQTLFCPVGICVNSNGDTYVTHKVSENDKIYKVTCWSSGGTKQKEVLTWDKTKAPPAIACQGQRLILARDKNVACYQIVF